MAIFASLFGMIGRYAGRIVNSALGWATILLFGRVPQSKQILLSVVTLGSIAWVVALLGTALPDLGTFLVTIVPAPKFVDRNLIRLAMLVAAIVLPLLVGIAGLFLLDKKERPKGPAMIGMVVRGYLWCLVLAVTLVFLAVIALARKVRTTAKRWEDAHIGIVVKPGGYETVVEDLCQTLDRANVDVNDHPAPKILALPAHLLAWAAGSGVGRLVPKQLMQLTGRDIEILVYPSDIAIGGKKNEVAQARAAIASRLTAAPAYLTTTAEAQKVEDRIEAIARQVRSAAGSEGVPARDGEIRRRLADLDRTLADLVVPYEEWEVLYRMRLQLERDWLTGREPGQEPAGQGKVGSTRAAGGEPDGRRTTFEWALAAGSIALVAADVTLSLVERISLVRARPRRRFPWS